MSTNRTNPQAGWADLDELPKGENGRRLCRRCGTEVPKGRRTFCCEPCVHEWRMRTDPGYARKQVEKRDHGVCAACGLDTKSLKRKAFHEWSEWEAAMKARGFQLGGHLWEADHIVPVVEGGGECGLENLRTLCIPCHKKATNELRQRLAHKRATAHNQGEMDMTARASETIEPITETTNPDLATEPSAGETIPPTEETMPGHPGPGEQEPGGDLPPVADPAELDVTIQDQAGEAGEDEQLGQEGNEIPAAPEGEKPEVQPALSIEDDPDIDEHRHYRTLERDLTDEERLKIGEEMAEALQQAQEYEEQKANIDSRLKKSIEAAYEQAATLGAALRKGIREGQVQVITTKNWRTGTVTVTRADTGAVLENRAMTYDERQREFFKAKTAGDTTPADQAGTFGHPEAAQADGFQNNPRIVETQGAQASEIIGDEPTMTEAETAAALGDVPEFQEPAPGEPGSRENPLEPIIETTELDPADALAQTAAEQVGNA